MYLLIIRFSSLSLHDALPILFHWGALKNEIEIARINLAVSNKDTSRIFREVSLLLRKAYLALIVEKARVRRSEEHTSELQSPCNIVCRRLLEKKQTNDRDQ